MRKVVRAVRRRLQPLRRSLRRLRHRILGSLHRQRLLRRAIRPTSPSVFRYASNGEYKDYGPLPAGYRDTDGCSIVVAGFPKSGNVWLTSLIAGCLDMPGQGTPGRCFVTHTHSALSDLHLFDDKLLRGAVLIRDLRDVVVSLFHFMRTDFFKQVQGPRHLYDDIDDMYAHYFLRYFANHFLPLEDLPEGYVRHGWPVLKYEKVYDDPARELARLFRIWGFDVPDERITSVVEANTIHALRKGGGSVPEKIVSTHFRKGGYGQYKSELPASVLKDIETRFGDYLRSWGYELSA